MKVFIKILRGLLTLVVGAVLACNVWMLVQQTVLHRETPEVFGYSQYIVTSGSMETVLSTGDLILVKSEEEYNLGDVVTFRDPAGQTVTHRIVGRVSDQFITKGDANNTEDQELLPPENILGKVQTALPGMGNVVLFFRSPLGLLILLTAVILILKLPDWAGALKTRAKGKHAYERES